MKILELRILPPIAIGRLGSDEIPLDAYDLTTSEENPLDFRTIVPKETLEVDPLTGEVCGVTPESIKFKNVTSLADKNGKIHPVAPFLEVFAVTDTNPGTLVPLTTNLLADAGLTVNDISWKVDLANIKVFRRTGDVNDKVNVNIDNITSHEPQLLQGICSNFLPNKTLPLGKVQFICPNNDHPEIRFRFTPGPGRVYGSDTKRTTADKKVGGQIIPVKREDDPVYAKYSADFLMYDKTKPWFGYREGPDASPDYTNPAQIFAGYDGYNGAWVSWGYIDDECDGFVSVNLQTTDGELTARAHISAGPPAFAPDTLPVRVVSDELEQIIYGPEIEDGVEVPIEEAEEIIRRALETVRLMNTAIMNGNPFEGRQNVASTMVRQDTNDFGRLFEPIMATSIVDNLAVRAIHERVFNGLSTGASPWFEHALRRPENIGKLSNEERRKMPGLMRGADGRALTLTHRQINTIIKCAADAMFAQAQHNLATNTGAPMELTDLKTQLHYRGTGNPISILPRTAISNCFPGLEFDFRNLWRRSFRGIVLIENNNYVVGSEETGNEDLIHHRLVGIQISGEDAKPTMVPTTGPVFPGGSNTSLQTSDNPNGVSFMEWSNNLATVLQHQGQQVDCYFTLKESPTEVVVSAEDLKTASNFIKRTFTVNNVFEENSAAFTDDIVKPGELTQGLCAPWQNDYRECACYYWAASRPDYVNVVPNENGLSSGDTWMSKKRTGQYIPDKIIDSQLLTYDDLFENWEGELNFIVKGNDAIDSNGDKTISSATIQTSESNGNGTNGSNGSKIAKSNGSTGVPADNK